MTLTAGSTIAELVPVLPESTGLALYRALSNLMALRAPAEVREDRIGLLVELLDATGEVPKGEVYDAERARRADRGEIWPQRTTLIKSFGNDWNTAVRAAMRHLHGAHSAVLPWKPQPLERYGPYDREEVLAAIAQCRRELGDWVPGDWPTWLEYRSWMRLRSEIARTGGHPRPRIPSSPTIDRWCGGYRRAVEILKGRERAAISQRGEAV